MNNFKKILITGASGMVGRNLQEYCPEKINLLVPSSKELNLLDYKEVESYLLRNKPEAIIHAAGKVGGIQTNIKYPVEFLEENSRMGYNLVAAARKFNVSQLINLSSSCIYPKDKGIDLRESDVLSGYLEPTNEGYALAKIMVIKLLEYTNIQYGTNYKSIIPCNIYGRWDSFNSNKSHLVPAIISKISESIHMNNKTVEIWGDGEARREFMYSGDLADFVWLCLSKYDQMPSLINVGLGKDFSVNDYYKTVALILGYEGRFVHNLEKPVGMKQKLLNVDKLNEFGWKPKFSLEDGLKETINFFENEYGK